MSKYYTLIGKEFSFNKWEVMFGGFDREDVEADKESYEDQWEKLKIIVTDEDQDSIDSAIAYLNKQ